MILTLQKPQGPRRFKARSQAMRKLWHTVQNSVFECQVDATQYVKLKHLLMKEIDEEKDSLRFYSLGNHYSGKVEHLACGAEYRWMNFNL